MKTVALYARVSTQDQNPGLQLRELRAFCKRRKFRIVKEYVDHVTGNVERRSRARHPRDENYRLLMRDATQARFDCVVVWKFDRLARSLPALLQALQHFGNSGVDFISCTQDIDTTTPMGRLIYGIVGAFAEFERELIAERARSGIQAAKKRGVKFGRPRDLKVEFQVRKMRWKGFTIRAIAARVRRSPAGVLKILKRG
jgi:DNA invertase Pin-like site-specific DNA recombinase